MTTELSTTMPKSTAPRLSRLAAMPKRNMPVKANSIERGIAIATIVAGSRVTIVGEVTGAVLEKMDEADYRYPTVDVKHLHRWEARQAEDPRSHGPWWGVFGGVGIGGGSRSGGGISIGF